MNILLIFEMRRVMPTEKNTGIATSIKKIQALISNKIVTIVKQATDRKIISTTW